LNVQFLKNATIVTQAGSGCPQRLEAQSGMFGPNPRRNNRKLRLSNWFARERDGDMQSFDVDGVASGIGVLVTALHRDAVRRSAGAKAG
jgi:hypothetical protein